MEKTTTKKYHFLLLLIINCGLTFHSQAATDIHFTILSSQQLPTTVAIYLTSEQPLPIAKSKAITIAQQGRKYSPYFSITHINNPVIFKNKDQITHHIYSVSTNNPFSFKLRKNHKEKQLQLAHAGEVAMGCNIHDWMSGFLLVVDSPYYGVTDKQGQLSFSVAPGTYQAHIWHPQLQAPAHSQTQEIVVNKITKNVHINLQYKILPIPLQQSADDFDFLDQYEE